MLPIDTLHHINLIFSILVYDYSNLTLEELTEYNYYATIVALVVVRKIFPEAYTSLILTVVLKKMFCFG